MIAFVKMKKYFFAIFFSKTPYIQLKNIIAIQNKN